MTRVTIILAALLATPALADVTVILRGGEQPLVGTSMLADAHGVDVRTGAAANAHTLVPWDMVRELKGSSVGASDAEFLAMGEDLWRARVRIERGDTPLALPLLSKRWAQLHDVEGPTAALVAEGLLRCALASGDMRGAIEPWLACLRHRAAGVDTRFPTLTPVIDADNGLLPQFSPFLPAARRADFVAACEAARTSAGSRDIAGAEVAACLARIAAGTPTAANTADPAAAPRTASPAVRALSAIETMLAAPDARALDKAVAAFDRAYAEPPSYLAAWRLAAIGSCRARLARATTGSTTGAARNAALSHAALELLAVPAASLDRTGLVDAYAIEQAAALIRESGDDASAAQLAALAADKIQSGNQTSAR